MTVPLPGDPLLAAKLSVPLQVPGLVRRRRLLNRLTRGTEGPLTLITGAPGAGKTALAASWAWSASAPGPLVWLTLDEDDTPGAFWAYVVEGFRRSGELAGDVLDAPVRADGADRSMLTRLAFALEGAPNPLVLVVDGLEKARGDAVHNGLRFLSDHAGPALRLVLISREEPLLPLHRYRAEGRLQEIREHDLAFTRSEAAQLLRGRGPAPEDHLVDLFLEQTQGWAAGLRLCALAMARSGDPAAFAGSLTASEQAVSDYLLTEVLAAQPGPARELLLRTGILNHVHPDLAAALTGRADSGRILQDLARRHAFVEPLPGTRWYRYHPLFAEVLRAHLRSGQPGLEPLLHRRAARWYAERGHSAEAVDEATAGGDWGFAADQTVRHLLVAPILAGSAAFPSADTFSRMPEDTPGARAPLVAAACCLARRDVEGCRARLARAQEWTTGPEAEPADLLTAALLRLLSAPGPADEEAHRVTALLARLPAEERERHPEIGPLCLYGQACAWLRGGRLQSARDGLERAVRACSGDATVLLRHRCLGRLALADALAGALNLAQQHGEASLAFADLHGIPDSQRSGAAGLALAAVAVEREELGEAAVQLDRAELLHDVLGDSDLLIERSVLRAQLELARGRWDAARSHLDGHLAEAAAYPAGPAVRLVVACATAALARGDVGAAAAALERIPADEGPPSYTVALAQVRAAADRPAQALELIEATERSDAVTLPDRVRLVLLRAHRALLDGREDTARTLLVEALDLARPEGLRRPFRETGPWVPYLAGRLNGHSASYAWLASPHPQADHRVVEELSRREREVLQQVARMMSTEEVAAELHVSVNTVKTHLRGIYRKLCVSRRRDAVERAHDLHML
ncbi:LuxR C-terminal-related transcriptional regulator [Streptomyces sp. NPDC090077]|uniref:LuxR C-terminal-related transcriptional regulator n=1 Tax=Streptomyces sp. NPDC090077 TaxID=3365938 RepID=UPI003808F6E2